MFGNMAENSFKIRVHVPRLLNLHVFLTLSVFMWQRLK